MSSARTKVRAAPNNSAASAPRQLFIELDEARYANDMQDLSAGGKFAFADLYRNQRVKNLFKEMSLRSGTFARISSAMSVRIIQVRPSRHSRWQKQGGWEVF